MNWKSGSSRFRRVIRAVRLCLKINTKIYVCPNLNDSKSWNERNFDMKLNDFLKPELLGNKFLAVKGYSEVLDRETQKLSAYRLNVSIQDENSDFFMEMIQVKVNNVSPSLSVQDLKNNKTTPVLLQDLNVGQFNGNLWFSCADVLPTNK